MKTILSKGKKAFVDPEILTSAGFIILALMAVGATAIGYIWAKKQGWDTFPAWQLIAIILAEVVAAYVMVARG